MNNFAGKLELKHRAAIAIFTLLMVNSLGASAATRDSAKDSAKESASEISPGAATPEERMNAVNRALEQSLAERAKSQREFEKNASIGRPRESWMMRKQQRAEQSNERNGERMAARASEQRNSREESQRQRRLNWLND